MSSSPFSSLIGGIGALIVAALAKYRIFWFLHDDTILSGGKQVSTIEAAAFISNLFTIFGVFAITLAFILLLTLSDDQRRRIAQLPRWRRFLVWPIDSHIVPRNPSK